MHAGQSCNVQTAVEDPSVASGDEVILLPGTYNLADPLVIDDSIAVHGTQADPEAVRIAATFDNAVLVDQFGAVISDLTIDHVGYGGLRVQRGTAERVIVSSTSAACVMDGQTPDAAVLRDSVCAGGGGPGVDSGSSGAGTDRYGTVVGVTAVSENYFAVEATAFAGSVRLDMRNSIARGGPSPLADLYAEANGSLGTAVAQIVASNSNYDTDREYGDVGGSASATDAGTGTNQTAAPLLQPAAPFAQLPGSPTIDAGAFDAFLGSFDLFGEARIEGAQPDIGADEADGTPPSVAIDSGPSGVTSDNTPTFTFSASEPVSYTCRFDVGPFNACSGPGGSHTPTSLADGTYTFEVRGSDGFASAVDARSFEVDTRPPRVTIDKGPRARTPKSTAKFKFSANEPGATFECKLDRGSYRACDSPARFRNLARGKHKFLVKATDAAGNTDGSPARYRWRRTGR